MIELRGWQPAPTVIITHTLVRSLFHFLRRFLAGILNQQYFSKLYLNLLENGRDGTYLITIIACCKLIAASIAIVHWHGHPRVINGVRGPTQTTAPPLALTAAAASYPSLWKTGGAVLQRNGPNSCSWIHKLPPRPHVKHKSRCSLIVYHSKPVDSLQKLSLTKILGLGTLLQHFRQLRQPDTSSV